MFGIKSRMLKMVEKVIVSRYGYDFYYKKGRTPRWFKADYEVLKQQIAKDNLPFVFYKPNPILNEKTTSSGTMKGPYFFQDYIMAQKIYKRNPIRHIDVGSRVDGFVSHVAVFRKIEIIDIRDNLSQIENIQYLQMDFMKPLSKDMHLCTDSISSLHALEHFGLGRYGDPVDAYGHIKGLDNIRNMLRPGGYFYLSVPIGRQRIEFNAHRVFGLKYLLDVLKKDYDLLDFSYVDDAGDVHQSIVLTPDVTARNCGCHLGCGIFELRKKG